MSRLPCLSRLPQAKRGESAPCRLRFAVGGPLSGIASLLIAAHNDIDGREFRVCPILSLGD